MVTQEPTEAQCACPHPHSVVIHYATGHITTPANIEDAGGCSEGCCDDFRCTACGFTFRVEWPD